MPNVNRAAIRLLIITCLLAVLASSCARTVTKAFLTPAVETMQQQSDLQLVCEGTPSYLLMIDSMIAADPGDPDLQAIGAQSYAGYIGAMIECGLPEERVQAMAEKGYRYATALLDTLLGIDTVDGLEDFSAKLQRADKHEADELFWAALALTVWIQEQDGAPAAMIWLAKLERLLERIVVLDEEVEMGGAHFLLGGYYGSRPSLFGGDPDRSRHHFEQALAISERKMLLYQVTYAQTYARQTLNRTLHDSLLKEVLAFDLSSFSEQRLANQIARDKAQRLLAEDFFAE